MSSVPTWMSTMKMPFDLLRPVVDLLDGRVAHDGAVATRGAGFALRDDGDHVEARLHRRRRVGSFHSAISTVESASASPSLGYSPSAPIRVEFGLP